MRLRLSSTDSLARDLLGAYLILPIVLCVFLEGGLNFQCRHPALRIWMYTAVSTVFGVLVTFPPKDLPELFSLSYLPITVMLFILAGIFASVVVMINQQTIFAPRLFAGLMTIQSPRISVWIECLFLITGIVSLNLYAPILPWMNGFRIDAETSWMVGKIAGTGLLLFMVQIYFVRELSTFRIILIAGYILSVLMYFFIQIGMSV